MSEITGIISTLPIIKQITSWIRKLILKNPKNWEGVKLNKRYFSWKGPTLDLLTKCQPLPTPQGLIERLRAAGMEPLYGRKNEQSINRHIAKGEVPVFETDRMNWCKELLLPEYGDQILFVKKVSKSNS